MKNEQASWLTLGGLLCLAVVLSFAASKVEALDAKLSALIRQELEMQTIAQQVTRTDGSVAVITTVRKDAETVASWLLRHDTAVAEAKKTP